jgi:hypothetical protein
MKKVLCLIALVGILLFSACSETGNDSNSNLSSIDSTLIGIWVNGNDYVIFNADATGFQFIGNSGMNFTWNAQNNRVCLTYIEYKMVDCVNYAFFDNELYLGVLYVRSETIPNSD